MSKGHPVRQDPTYKRQGYTSLVAALFVHKDEVYGKAIEKHRSIEFIQFLDELGEMTDPKKGLYIILDNLSLTITPHTNLSL